VLGGANRDAYGDDRSTNAPAGCPAWPESIAIVWFHCHRAFSFAALPALKDAAPAPAARSPAVVGPLPAPEPLASPSPAATLNESRGNLAAVVEGWCV
jgi:hypothetical protein